MKKVSSFSLMIILVGAAALFTVGAAPRMRAKAGGVSGLRAIKASNSLSQEEGAAITKSNWRQHPKIKEVRNIVQAVKAGMAGKSLIVRKRTFEYCESYEDVERRIAYDS